MPKAVSNQHLADLIATGQNHDRERWEAMKTDIDAKHAENVNRRHDLGNKYSALEGRVTIVETKLTSIVGDNSGGSGLLHEIRDKVDALKTEVEGIKKTVEDTPSINKWVIGAAAVTAFVVVILPMMLFIVFEILKLLRH